MEGMLAGSEVYGPILKLLASLKYSVQFSHSVMSDSLRPHELQHARPACQSSLWNVKCMKYIAVVFF